MSYDSGKLNYASDVGLIYIKGQYMSGSRL